MSTINIKQPEGGLLQSREWANMLRAEGKDIVTVNYKKNIIAGVVQLVRTQLCQS